MSTPAPDEITLRDGTVARLRPVRPADEEAIRDLYARLSLGRRRLGDGYGGPSRRSPLPRRPHRADDLSMGDPGAVTEEGGGARIRVVVAEPHDGMRRALIAALRVATVCELVAAVADLGAAGAALRRHRAEVLVADLGLLATTRRELGPFAAATAVVALGLERESVARAAAHRLGADRYVAKQVAHDELVRAVLAAAETLRR